MIVTIPTMCMIHGITRYYCPYRSHQNWQSPSNDVIKTEKKKLKNFEDIFKQKSTLYSIHPIFILFFCAHLNLFIYASIGKGNSLCLI